jgi:uncharacterized integral membrane protein
MRESAEGLCTGPLTVKRKRTKSSLFLLRGGQLLGLSLLLVVVVSDRAEVTLLEVGHLDALGLSQR